MEENQLKELERSENSRERLFFICDDFGKFVREKFREFFYTKKGKIALAAAAIGAFAVAATAYGVIAIGKMAVGDAHFESLSVNKMKINHLKVKYLEVEEQI